MGLCRHVILASLAVTTALPLCAAPSGTYEDWRGQVWRSTLATSDGVSGAEADPDGDGLVNFAEYALGLDPTVADPPGTARWRMATNGAALVLRHEASRSAREASMLAAWTDDLLTGAWLAPDGTNLLEQSEHGGASRRALTYTLPLETNTSRFGRLLARRTLPPPSPPAWVWFEAEPPGNETNTLLSSNSMSWLNAGSVIQKDLTIPADGNYRLWVRKFTNPQAFQWRTDSAASWAKVSRTDSAVLSDLVDLGTNSARNVGWLNAGDLVLAAGTQMFRCEVFTNQADTTAYDCFVLTRDPFQPRGKLKPDELSGAVQPGWFPFEPEPDVLTYSPIDLRRLNEPWAGAGGFIGTNAGGFMHQATGEAARFWGVNLDPEVAALAPDEVDLLAGRLAKRGVNLVRYRGPVCITSGPSLGTPDPGAVQRLHYLVAAMKREGIYTSLSIYDPRWLTLNAVNTAFPGYTNRSPFGLVYFNTNFQTLYRSGWQGLLTTTNAYTGLALRDDPALAFVELVNEESTLDWTFDPFRGAAGNIPDPQRALLEQQFSSWLTSRYAPRPLADIRLQVWAGLSTAQDNPATGRMGLRSPWDLSTQRTKRDQDTAQFLAKLMRDFYGATATFLRTNCGYRGLVSGSNGKTASPVYLEPLDREANGAGDFLDRHGSFDSYHQGKEAAASIRAGQVYDDRAAVRFQAQSGTAADSDSPVFDLAYNGGASTIQQINWSLPNRYRADMTFLAASYGCLQGTDAIGWFSCRSVTWDILPGKFSVQTPAGLGQFPAAALLYRLGLVQTGPPVVDLEFSRQSLNALQGIPIPTAMDFAALRGTNAPGGKLTNSAAIDSLAFLVGRVGLRITTNAQPRSWILDLGPYVDRTHEVVTSLTGELRWDYGRGLVTVNAPAAQGATGFLGAAGRLELGDLAVESPMDYGTVLVVSLDGQPLPAASRLLVQTLSEEQPYGWGTSATSGQRTILRAGQAPLLVRNLAGNVTFNWPEASSLLITPLDINGYRILGAERAGPVLTLQTNVFYYLVERGLPPPPEQDYTQRH